MNASEQDAWARYRVPETLVQDLISRGRPVTIRRGQIVVGHFDEARDVYFVESGSAQVSLLSRDGKEAIFRELSSGELFGELAALDGAPRSASVVATSDMVLHKITADQFEAWISAHGSAGLWLSRLLVARIRDMTERSFELATMNVTRRVHLEILRLAEQEGATGDEVTIAKFPTHSEFAARIGTHREAISRELGWLRSSGIIETQGRRLTLLDTAQLRKLAGG